MKTKLLFILALLSSIAFESSAFKIIIQGGGQNNKYYRVYITARRVECTGAGNNSCLINLSVAGSIKPIFHPVNDVISYVRSQVEQGNTNGDTTYENDLPVQWTSSPDGTLEINIDETAVQRTEE